MHKHIIRQVTIIAALVATVVVNFLANRLPLNGQQTGEISDQFPIYITPAGYVFAIWVLIYLGLAGYALFQALPSQRENPRLQRIATPFVLSCAANCAWLFLWHYERFGITELAMLGLLLSLITIYNRLGRGPEVSRAERWLVNLPFSIYLGWITVATIVNTTVVLYNSGWNGFGLDPQFWTALLLVIATVIGCTILLRRRDVAFALVLVWAFAGIALKHPDTTLVAPVAWVMAAIVILTIGISLSRIRPPWQRSQPRPM